MSRYTPSFGELARVYGEMGCLITYGTPERAVGESFVVAGEFGEPDVAVRVLGPATWEDRVANARHVGAEALAFVLERGPSGDPGLHFYRVEVLD